MRTVSRRGSVAAGCLTDTHARDGGGDRSAGLLAIKGTIVGAADVDWVRHPAPVQADLAVLQPVDARGPRTR